MGLITKIKSIFYDEEIIDVPAKEEKKEEVKPRIEEVVTPKRESVPPVQSTSTYSERELFKSEPTFKFPVVDEDDEEIPQRSSVNVMEVERREQKRVEVPVRPQATTNTSRLDSRYDMRTETPKAPASKAFTPSPVISPIYGILDKNYKKEQIQEKKDVHIARTNKDNMNYDYVRRKAYGTLEDELANTLTKMSNEVLEDVTDLEKDIDKIDKPSKSIEDLLNEIESNANVSIGELEERIKDREEIKEEHVETVKPSVKEEVERVTEEINFNREVKEEVGDKTLEHDLFNLIDSMYEEKKGE